MLTTNLFQYVKKHISPEQIYRKYIDNVVFDKKIKSPLRNNDDNPSFIIYSNNWVFVDFAYAKGDWLNFVCYKYNLNYSQAITKIASDFNLTNSAFNNIVENNNIVITKNSKTYNKKEFKIIYRNWNTNDKNFWLQFNISKKTLDFFNVKPIIGFWTTNKNSEWFFFKTDYISYVYHIGSRIKIYQPLRTNDNFKFLGNTSKNSVQGYTQIDFLKPQLIITSSLKDVMVLYENGYQAIAPSSESTVISQTIIDFLLDNLPENTKPIIFYDWDDPGINLAKTHSAIYKIPFVIPNNYKELLNLKIKDPSDHQKHFKTTKNFLKTILNEYVN